MGPIMQERTASTTLKRVSSKDKIKVRNAENTGLVTSSKKGNKVKKASGQLKNGLPGQEKDLVATVHKGTQSRGGKVKAAASRNTSKLSSPQDERPFKSPAPKHSSTQRKEEKREMQRLSPCCNEVDQNQSRMGRNRRALSLPLSPIAGLRHMPMHSPAPTPEAMHRHYAQNEDDTDSASDLSDSERLPVLPSPCTPCTPPHLDLRAEVIDTSDFPPDFPGPCGAAGGEEEEEDGDEAERPAFSYPEFLPPPFNSWSLRQLAVFLHTEGRSAPRPKPVGPLERYLERLLQLEWHQIQTVQAEGARRRQPGAPSSAAAPPAAHPPRPHTAPPPRLNSPKGPRQGQRAPPSVSLNTPTSPAAPGQPPPGRYPVCPQCHIRYPLCNGSCSPYAYQRHSRLSPLMERRARNGAGAGAGVPPKRSSSESRATSSDGRASGGGGGGGGGGGAQTPVSPSSAKSHVKQMQAAGNARKTHHLEPGAGGGGGLAGGGGGGGGSQAASGSNGHIASGSGSQVASGGGSSSQVASGGQVATARGQQRKGRVRANSETDVKKEAGTKGPNAEKRITSGGKRELNAARKAERDGQRAEAGGTAAKPSMKRTTKEPASLSRPPGSKPNGKAKNVHFVAK